MPARTRNKDIVQEIKEVIFEYVRIVGREAIDGSTRVSLVWRDGLADEEISCIYLENPNPED